MKTRYVLPCLLAFTVMIAMWSGCVKIQNRVLIKGTWELVHYSLDYKKDTTGLNYMELMLPDYTQSPGCCKYMIDFKDDGKVTGSYYVLDTLNYSVDGTWSLDEKNELYIDLDHYVSGLFDVDREDRKNYVLITDSNIVDFGGGVSFIAPIKMDIKRRF